ncbi:MAG: ATP-binding protein [Pseudanabaenaceae cyanobacterium]
MEGVVCVGLAAPWGVRRQSGCLQFASTLYFQPVLAFLVGSVPPLWQAEIRLGLQEALVNAARHGNKLDPRKKITVEYCIQGEIFSWRITDQGEDVVDCFGGDCPLPDVFSEQGRGVFILYQIFDRVEWSGHTLYLEKHLTPGRCPFIL